MALAKLQSQRRIKRLGAFKASSSSRPTFTGEEPRSMEAALSDLGNDVSHVAAGHEALGYIDEMLALAHQVAQEAADGEIESEPEGLWWKDDAHLMQGLAADSARGFAIRMMLDAGPITGRIMGLQPMEPQGWIFLVRDVLRFAARYNALRVEWVDGPDVAGAQAAQVARAEGGRRAAQAKGTEIRRRQMAWQREAEAIWRKNANLTKIAVARIIAERFKAKKQFAGSVHTIRATVKKPD